MYPYVVFLHVLSAFGFLFAHGVTAFVMLKLPTETNHERVRALLEVHNLSAGAGFISLGLLLLSGIVAGIWFNWFSQAWIWISLVLLILISGVMTPLGRHYFERVMRAAGIRSPFAKKDEPTPEPGTDEELRAALTSGRPRLVLIVALAGWAAIVWLMMFKPF